MSRRQSIPEQWLIIDKQLDRRAVTTIRNLPRGRGVLVLCEVSPGARRRLRNLAVTNNLTVMFEGPGAAARIHNIRELTCARLRRTPLILISPIHRTRSHPDWKPLPRMRAAVLAQLADRQAIALGGMDEKRFRRVQPLGFVAWAGIGAWLKVTKVAG